METNDQRTWAEWAICSTHVRCTLGTQFSHWRASVSKELFSPSLQRDYQIGLPQGCTAGKSDWLEGNSIIDKPH